MSKLKSIREFQNLTQEELSNKCGVSVRTIQRIESGKEPKGYTLRVIAKALEVEEIEFLAQETIKENSTIIEKKDDAYEKVFINYSSIKLINLLTIPVILIPPFNIIIPIILMLVMKQKNNIVKQLISVQILWTIIAPIVFMLGIFLKLGNTFTLLLLIAIVLSNIFIILSNAIEIDKNKKLRYALNFNMI